MDRSQLFYKTTQDGVVLISVGETYQWFQDS